MLEDNLLPEVSDLYGTAMDPYDARIRELIARLARPDDPSMVPTTPQLPTGGTIARTGLAGLGDLLTAIGFSKGGRIPPSSFLSQVANENNQRREAVAENARRVRQASIEGDKTGAEYELRDLQEQRRQDLVQRAQDLKDKQEAAKLELAKRHQSEVMAFREKQQQQRIEALDKTLASREKIARMRPRGGAGGSHSNPAVKAFEQRIKTERRSYSDLLAQREKLKILGIPVDDNAYQSVNDKIDASLAKLEELTVQQEEAATQAPAQTAPATHADGFGPLLK